jgi:2-polyprenyl-3-methyl-5-hydroxy-6-metoxy-1,4-benzoquinol methylase
MPRAPFSTLLARWVLTRFERFPVPPTQSVGDLQEVFNHPAFTEASPGQKLEIMARSSESKYRGEQEYPWDHYFECNVAPWLEGKKVLDLGCFNGGRTVAWFERYKIREMAGIDVDPNYAEAADHFATSRGVSADFRVGLAEHLPFSDASFDAVVSFDVFEHVTSVEAALRECARVLRPTGTLIAVFPGYFQPNEHHLGHVTRLPGLQLLFSGETLVRAYHAVLSERGKEANWYARRSPELESWESGHTLNGTTFRAFRGLIASETWDVRHVSRRPLGSVGRNAARVPLLGTFGRVLRPLTFVPGLQEILLHRVAVVLQRRAAVPAR